MDKLKFINKFDSGYLFQECELEDIIDEYSFEDIEMRTDRWTKQIKSICDIDNRLFAICWDSGLTECQENGYNSQPIEVEKKGYEKTIIVTEYVPIKKENK